MTKIKINKFRIKKKCPIKIHQWPTQIGPYYSSNKNYKVKLIQGIEKLSKQQQLLYATNKLSLLIIFQAMDSAGKDGAIRHVLSGINPQGVQVFSFKHPSTTELDHDFLWRTTNCLPERGRIGIFNRSYYEEVLIAKVHPEILRAEKLSSSHDSKKSLWPGRYQSINDLEKHLHRNGTRIIKIFLHLSKEEQRKRFLERIDQPEKNWKFNISDIQERKYWDQYMNAYQDCLSLTSTPHAPWYVVPADDKRNARLIISQIILEAFEDLKMSYPKSSKARKKELAGFRQLLEV